MISNDFHQKFYTTTTTRDDNDGFNICAVEPLSVEEALCLMTLPTWPPHHLLSSDLSAINTTFNGKLFQLSGEISKRLLTPRTNSNFKQVFSKAEHATLVLV